jgi:hypothetical protein
MIVLNGRQLDKIDEELSIEVLKPKGDGVDGDLLVKVTIQRILVFSGQRAPRHLEQGSFRCAETPVEIV